MNYTQTKTYNMEERILKSLILKEEEAEEKKELTPFEEDPMGFILNKYSSLNELLTELMTDSFKEYLTAIFIVAPKPTTFKILLHNGQYLFLTFLGKAYEATISGKKYYLMTTGEKQLCMQAIARLLRFGSPLKTKGPEGTEQGTEGEEGATETPETPPAEGGEEEALTETAILSEIVKRALFESPESEITAALGKNKNVSAMAPGKVVKSGANTYKVYFNGVNIKDKKGRSDLMTQIASTKGVKAQLAKGLSSIGHVKLTTPSGTYNVLVKGTSETATSTNVKEGLVILFYYADVSNPVTEKSFNATVNKLSKTLNKIKNLDSKTQQELFEFLQSASPSKEAIALLNQPLSQALAIRQKHPNAEVVRSGIFNDYRAFAQQTLGLPADKWCPGDVYVVLNEKKARAILETAKKQDESQAIGVLNQAFATEWGSKKAPMVAVSLKFEKAQGGKAKAYFEKFKAAKTEYNLDSKELSYGEKAYRQGVERLRKSIQSYVKGNPNIKYNIENSDVKAIAADKLRGKYAALKAINFFFSQVSSQEGSDAIDDSLVALAAFAMSLGDTSPTFFKVVANTAGKSAEVEKFEGGTALSLYVDDKIKPIIMTDSATFGGLVIDITASKSAEEKIKITINARNNGLSQGTIEIAKIKPIN